MMETFDLALGQGEWMLQDDDLHTTNTSTTGKVPKVEYNDLHQHDICGGVRYSPITASGGSCRYQGPRVLALQEFNLMHKCIS